MNKARRAADAAGCASHLQQIGAAFNLYAIDNDGTLPLIDRWGTTGGAVPEMVVWYTEIAPYLGIKKMDSITRRNPIWSCPTIGRSVPISGTAPDYELNRDVSITKDGYVSGAKLGQINSPTQKIMLFCTARRRSSLTLAWIQGYGPGPGWGNLMNPAAGDAGLSNFCEAHNGQANVLWADGHVAPTTFSAVNDVRFWIREK